MKVFILVFFVVAALSYESVIPHMFNQFYKGGFHDLITPISANITVDCTVRIDIYDYAKKVLPDRGELKSVFVALQLSSCGVESPVDDKPVRVPESQWKVDGESFYVDGVNGNDNNNGSFENPFKTIQIALDKSRSIQGKKVIYIRKGEYYIENPLELNNLDNSLTITAYQDEEVILSGSRQISPEWKPYRVHEFDVFENQNAIYTIKTDHSPQPGESFPNRLQCYGKFDSVDECQKQCDQDEQCQGFTYHTNDAKEWSNYCYGILTDEFLTVSESNHISGKKINVYVADLSKENLDTFTQVYANNKRQIRARYPNGDSESLGYHTNPSNYIHDKSSWDCCKSFGSGYEIHISDPHLEYTHYNNYHMALEGVSTQWSDHESYWALEHPVGGGACTYRIPKGINVEDFYTSPREWKNPMGGIVHAFHGGYWGFWMFEIDNYKYDETNKVRSIHWTKGGFQEARGGSNGGDYFIENIFEELDSRGEWFYDKTTKQLFLYPNGTIDDYKYINIPRTQRLVEIIGSSTHPVEDITLRGIVFQDTETTFMEPHEVPSGGDIAIHRGGSIFVQDAENVHISYNILRNLGGTGVFFSNHVKNSIIDHNEIFKTGDSGILFVGSSNHIDGTQPNHPVENTVEYNLIHETGIYQKQSSPFMQSKAARTLIRNNVLFNGPRAGINFNDAFGGGHNINHNVIFNEVRETGDHGGINTWDRIPYITTYRSGIPSLLPQQSNVTDNFIIGNYHSVWPIDHDDGSSYYYDSNNVLAYGGFKNYLGNHKIASNNLYIYPDTKNADVQLTGLGDEWFLEPHCATSDGAGMNDSGADHHYTHNKCIINNPVIYKYTGCSDIEHIKDLIPETDFNDIYTPHIEDSQVTCDGKTWNMDYMRSLGFDKNTTFHSLPDHIQIDQWIREKLQF